MSFHEDLDMLRYCIQRSFELMDKLNTAVGVVSPILPPERERHYHDAIAQLHNEMSKDFCDHPARVAADQAARCPAVLSSTKQ